MEGVIQIIDWQRKIFGALAVAAILLVTVAAFAASADAPAATSGLTAAFEQYQPYVLSILRIMVGLLFLQHGMAKIFNFPPQGDMPVFLRPDGSLAGSNLSAARSSHSGY